VYLSDNTRARLMKSDGTYTRLKPPSESKAVDVQQWLMAHAHDKKTVPLKHSKQAGG
jgi:hypothetical protein